MPYRHLRRYAAYDKARGAPSDPASHRETGVGEVESTLKQACFPGGSAMCVQRLDDSRSAIRITYRISLRSSSSQEPRYPLLKVVTIGVSAEGQRQPRLARDALQALRSEDGFKCGKNV